MKSFSMPHGGRALLFVECMVLFFIGPAALFFVRHWFAWRITPIVLLFSFLCAVFLLRDNGFDRNKLWDVSSLGPHLRAILLTFLFPALSLALFTYAFHRRLFLYFISAEPWLWLVFVLLYPVLACYPQEVLFRAFFFHRYQPLFPGRGVMIALSGLSFGLAHLFFNNALAPVLATFGGMLFAYRYARADTVVASALEHGLWGNFLFTIGLGWYFYSGSIR
jgi:uncharacterized protein